MVIVGRKSSCDGKNPSNVIKASATKIHIVRVCVNECASRAIFHSNGIRTGESPVGVAGGSAASLSTACRADEASMTSEVAKRTILSQ